MEMSHGIHSLNKIFYFIIVWHVCCLRVSSFYIRGMEAVPRAAKLVVEEGRIEG